MWVTVIEFVFVKVSATVAAWATLIPVKLLPSPLNELAVISPVPRFTLWFDKDDTTWVEPEIIPLGNCELPLMIPLGNWDEPLITPTGKKFYYLYRRWN